MKKTYEFENLGCAHCAGKMEEKIGKLPEVESVNLSFPMKKMYVETSSEDLLPVIQKICTDIEPDVIVTEVSKKSGKRKEQHSHEDHCSCGCEDHDHDHEHHDHEHHHDDHCGCGCCDDDDDDDDDEPIAAAANRQGKGQATVFIVEKLGCAHCAGKMKNRFHICQE